MNKTKIDDGYSSYLVEEATFVGRFQIPQLIFQEVPIPKILIPFDKRKGTTERTKQSIFTCMTDFSIKLSRMLIVI